MAKRITKAEKLSQGLVSLLGCKEVKCEDEKFRQFSIPDNDDFFFVGKRGALRIGKSVEKTISWSTSPIYKKIMEL